MKLFIIDYVIYLLDLYFAVYSASCEMNNIYKKEYMRKYKLTLGTFH